MYHRSQRVLSKDRSIGSAKCRKSKRGLTIESSRSTSPFWRRRPSNGRHSSSKGRGYDPNVVVGASYSHADMLKFDSLYV